MIHHALISLDGGERLCVMSMTFNEMHDTLKACKELLPPEPNETWAQYFKRCRESGILTKDERLSLSKRLYFEGNDLDKSGPSPLEN